MKLVMPERKFLIIIIAFAFVNPLNYAVMALFPPEGKVFLGYIDDAFQLALMKAVKWNFESPWDPGTSVFQNPVLGASYTFVLLGTLPALLNLNMFLFLMLLKFLLSVAYLVLVYNFINRFFKEKVKADMAFLLFLFSSGIGWILYGASLLLSGQQYTPVIGYAFTNEFEELGGGAHALAHLTRVYWLLPEITGLLALLFFMNRKYIISGLLLGLTILFYPTFAIAFALIIAVYSLVEQKGNIANAVKTLVPVALVSALFAVPWAVNYLSDPFYFSQYRVWFNALPPVTLFITFALTLSLALYGFLRTSYSLLKNKLFMLAFLFFALLSSVMHVYEMSAGSKLLSGWLAVSGLSGIGAALSANKIFVDVPFMLLFIYLFYDILRGYGEKNYKFILLWIVAISAATVVSADFVFWWSARMRWFMLLPLSIAAVAGIEYLSKKKPFGIKLAPEKIVLAVAVISLPSLIGFNYYMQQVARSSDLVYVSENDYKAMVFLRGIEDGRVLSSYQIGNNIPYFTGRQSLLFNGDDWKVLKRTRDYDLFYSLNATDEERLRILREYNITYVFYGYNERKLSNRALNLESADFLVKIYDSDTQVFRIIS